MNGQHPRWMQRLRGSRVEYHAPPSVSMEARGPSLYDARKQTLAGVEDGTTCPCCGQHVKLYKRKLNSSMANGLIYVNQYFRSIQDPDEWLHLSKFFTQHRICSSNDGGLLRHWGLIQAKPGERDDGSWRNGYYRITKLGVDFVQGLITVPKYAFLYNQTLYGLSDGVKYPRELTTIQEALTARFNYEELMKR